MAESIEFALEMIAGVHIWIEAAKVVLICTKDTGQMLPSTSNKLFVLPALVSIDL